MTTQWRETFKVTNFRVKNFYVHILYVSHLAGTVKEDHMYKTVMKTNNYSLSLTIFFTGKDSFIEISVN
jgi:hypothetical protein